MSAIDDDIDRLYQGPLDAFTDERNALAKAAKRPELKALVKPSVPAWAVNQLYWHERPIIDRLVAASDALLAEHRRRLAGDQADIGRAESAHREALRAALAAARDRLTAGGQAATPPTLEAVRQTLQALPSPEANGRLVRPLSPQGLEALAGLVLAARSATAPGARARPAPVTRPVAAAPTRRDAPVATSATETRREQAARERAEARARAASEKAARERVVRRAAAEAAVQEARAALARAEAAVDEAERDLATRQAERVAAREALKRAQRAAEELSFGR